MKAGCLCPKCRRERESRTVRIELPFIELTPEYNDDQSVLSLVATISGCLTGLDELGVKVGEEGSTRTWLEAA